MVGHIFIELQHIIPHTFLVDINECKHYKPVWSCILALSLVLRNCISVVLIDCKKLTCRFSLECDKLPVNVVYSATMAFKGVSYVLECFALLRITVWGAKASRADIEFGHTGSTGMATLTGNVCLNSIKLFHHCKKSFRHVRSFCHYFIVGWKSLIRWVQILWRYLWFSTTINVT